MLVSETDMEPTRISHQTVLGFSHLFAGRTDAWWKGNGKGGTTQHRPVHLGTFRGHLVGRWEMGTYPVTDDARCRWGCIDIDKDDMRLATDVHSVWSHHGIQSWIEVSRSKGYHVWTFANDWVPATVMRNAGLWVAEVAELGKVEVNPKNDAAWKVKTGLVN